MAIKVGLCGFTVAISDYARSFPVVEVQQTFYEPPGDATLERWRAEMPEGFEFIVKAWQLITHEAKSPTYRRLKRPLDAEERAGCGRFRDSTIVREALVRTIDCARILSASTILFQSPASFSPDPENIERLRAFFVDVANPLRPRGLRYLWEPRGPAWVQRASFARELCRELELGHVIDPFVTTPVAAVETYYRLHGVSGARHVYTDAELQWLARALPPSGHVMFNNIPRLSDAKRFLRLLKQSPLTASTGRQRVPPG